MAAIEEKLVRLKMDNADLKRKAAESSSTLSNLTNSLKKIGDVSLSGITKGVSGIQKVFNSLSLRKPQQEIESLGSGKSLSGLQHAIDTINSRFSAMGEVSARVLQNLTDRAMSAGKAVINAFGTSPIKQGFGEYELNQNSIKTIMANVEGAKIEDVNATLDELNDYADLTVYSFGDMTNAIGRFTAAGVGLKESTTAIKGLSNLAASGGASTQDLAGAYIQIAQALGSGVFRAMDWKSIQNANLNTRKFRDSLQEAAVARGTLNEKMADGEFYESLSKEWLTTEVFMDTLDKFANDQVMLDAATKVITFTQLIDTLKESIGSGWAESFRTIIGDFEQASDLFTRLKDIIGGAFDKNSAKRNKMLMDFAAMGGRDAMVNSLFNSLEALGRVMTVVGNAWSKVFPPVTATGLLSMVKSFEQFTQKLKMSESTAKAFESVLQGLFAYIKVGVITVKEMGSAIGKIFQPELIKGAVDLVKLISDVGKALLNATSSGKGLVPIIRAIGDGFAVLGRYAGLGLQAIVAALREVIFNWDEFSQKIQNGTNFALKAIMAFAKQVGNVLKTLFDGTSFAGGLEKAFKGIGNFFQNFKMPKLNADSIKEFFSSLNFGSIKIPNNPIKSLIDMISNAGQLIASAGSKLKSGLDKVISFIEVFANGIGYAINTVQILFRKLAESINFGDIVKVASLASFINIAKQVSSGLDLIGQSLEKFVNGISARNQFTNIALMSASLLALSVALKQLVGTDFTSLVAGVASLTVISAALVGLSKALDSVTIKPSVMVNLVLATTAITRISKSAATLAKLPVSGIVAGTAAIATLMTGLTLFSQAISGLTFNKGTVSVIMSLATSLLLMTAPVKILASMDLQGLVQGLLSVGTIIAAFVAFMNSVPGNVAGMAGMSAAMISLATAMNMLIIPVAAFGAMPLPMITQGLLSLGAALAMLTLSAVALSPVAAHMMAAGVGMISLAAAVNLLIGPILALGNLPWQPTAIGIGLVAAALAAIGLVVGGVGTILGPGMLAFGTSLMQVGAASLMANSSVLILGVGLGLLVQAIVNASNVLPTLAQNLVAFIQALTAAAGEIGNFVSTLGQSLIQALVNIIVQGLKMLIDGVVQLLAHLESVAPQIAESIGRIATGIVQGLTQAIPDFVNAAIQLAVALIDGLVQGIMNNRHAITDAFKSLLAGLGILIMEFMIDITKDIPVIGKKIREGLEPAIKQQEEVLKTTSANIKKQMDETAKATDDAANKMKQSGEKTKGLFDPVKVSAKEASAEIKQSFSNLNFKDPLDQQANGVVESFKGMFGKIDMDGFFNRIKSSMGAFNFSEMMSDMGMEGAEGFNLGLEGVDVKGFFDKIQNGMNPADFNALMKEYGIGGSTSFGEGFEEGTSEYDFSTDITSSVEEAGNAASETASVAGAEASASMWDAWKSGLSPEEFTAYGQTLGYDFSHGLWSGNHITDAGVEMMNQLQASLSPEQLAELGRSMGVDLSGGLTHEGGQYVTEAGAEIIRRLSQGMLTDSELQLIGAALGLELSNQVSQAEPQVQEAGRRVGTVTSGSIEQGILEADVSTPVVNKVNEATTAAEAAGAEGGRRVGVVTAGSLDQGILEADTSTSLNNKVQESINGVDTTPANSKGQETTNAFTAGATSVDLSAIGTSLMTGLVNVLAAAQNILNSQSAGKAVGEAFASGIEGTSSNATSAGKTVVDAALNALKQVDYTPAGTENGNEFVKGLQSTSSSATSTGKSVAEAAKTAAAGVSFTSAGKENGDEFVQGVESTSGSAKSAGTSVADSAKSGLESVSAYSSGSYLVAGFARGISGSVYLATSAASYVAWAAKQAIDEALGVASPAKELIPTGHWTVAGFALGIEKSSHLGEEAAENMALRAVDGLNSVIEDELNDINGGIEINPRIVPVFDDSAIPDNPFPNQNGVISAEFVPGATQHAMAIDREMNNIRRYTPQSNSNTVNNTGMFEGAVFNVREDADIEKIAYEVDNVLRRRMQLDDIFSIGKV